MPNRRASPPRRGTVRPPLSIDQIRYAAQVAADRGRSDDVRFERIRPVEIVNTQAGSLFGIPPMMTVNEYRDWWFKREVPKKRAKNVLGTKVDKYLP